MTTKIKFPKIAKRDLQLVQRIIRYGTDEEKRQIAISLRCQYGIDWDRKSLNVKTGEIVCEWIKTLNHNYQYDRIIKT